MPVYLDEKDSRKEFIGEQLKKINCGLSEFMAYVHMSTEFGWECGDEIDTFIEDWYMAPTSVRECLEQAHIKACLNRWPKGKIPNHITDYRISD